MKHLLTYLSTMLIIILTISSCNVEKKLRKKYTKHPMEFCGVAAQYCQPDKEIIIKDSVVIRDSIVYKDTTIYIQLPSDTVYKTKKVVVKNGIVSSDTLRLKVYPAQFKAWVQDSRLYAKGYYYTDSIKIVLENAQRFVSQAKEHYHKYKQTQTFRIETSYIPRWIWWLVLALLIICIASNRKFLVNLIRKLLIKV